MAASMLLVQMPEDRPYGRGVGDGNRLREILDPNDRQDGAEHFSGAQPRRGSDVVDDGRARGSALARGAVDAAALR
jgi:hypothetical protein